MGTQNIKAQVHLVETDEDNPTRVSMTRMPQKGKLVAHIAGGEFRRYLQMGYKPQHLYFTTDEEIKEPCWIIAIRESDGKEMLLYIENIPDNPKYFDMKGGYALFRHLCRKIVATTNPELWDIKHRFQSEGANSFSHLLPDNGVPKIDTPFIEAYIKAYNEGNPIKEVLLELATSYTENELYKVEVHYKHQLKLKSNGSVIIHPVKERVYTREEFRAAVRQAWIYSSGFVKFEEWFNKNYSE